MVDLKRIVLACLLLLGSVSAINYVNYSQANITGFGEAIDYSRDVMQTATGYNAFGLMLIGTIFIVFYIIGSRYTQERALVYSIFMTTLAAFVLVSGNFLDPQWLILLIIALLISTYLASSRVG